MHSLNINNKSDLFSLLKKKRKKEKNISVKIKDTLGITWMEISQKCTHKLTILPNLT